MSDASPSVPGRGGGRRRPGLWLAIGAGLLLLVGANWHLVHVALTSQPDCVDHIRPGQDGRAGSYSAARSACSPR